MRYKHVFRDFDRCDDTKLCKHCSEEQRKACDEEFATKEGYVN